MSCMYTCMYTCMSIIYTHLADIHLVFNFTVFEFVNCKIAE